MRRIRSSDFAMAEPNRADDEAYHVIIDCIKSYRRALKLGDTFKRRDTCHLIQEIVECRIFM